MATIKELAAKHNLCNNDQTTMVYRLGAIEVLEEIEAFCQLFRNKNDGYEIPVDCILGKIKQLRGE